MVHTKGGSEKHIHEVDDMHFTFGYCKEVPVKIKRNPSKTALVGLAILVVLFFVFLSFENLDKDTSIPPSIFERSPSLDKPDQPTEMEEIEFEKGRIFPEENAELILCEILEA